MNEPQNNNYIIDYTALVCKPQELKAFKTTLEPFEPMYLRLVPYASITIPREHASNLTALLDGITGITYRPGEPRSILESRVEEQE